MKKLINNYEIKLCAYILAIDIISLIMCAVFHYESDSEIFLEVINNITMLVTICPTGIALCVFIYDKVFAGNPWKFSDFMESFARAFAICTCILIVLMAVFRKDIMENTVNYNKHEKTYTASDIFINDKEITVHYINGFDETYVCRCQYTVYSDSLSFAPERYCNLMNPEHDAIQSVINDIIMHERDFSVREFEQAVTDSINAVVMEYGYAVDFRIYKVGESVKSNK